MTRARHIVFMVAMLGLVWMPGQIVGQLPQVLAKLGISTVGTEPATLTAAEIEKVIQLERSPIVETLPIPAGVKPPEKCTIEIGPPGLNAAELAKAYEAGASGKGNEAGASAKADDGTAGGASGKGR
jgi:hypothetical protein